VGVLTAPPQPIAQPLAPTDTHWWERGPTALVAPTPPAAPELSTEARGLERILANFSERDSLRLPSLPKAAEAVLRLLGSRNADARRIAAVIAEDQVLSMTVLRSANSALYGGLQHVQDLQTAVARLGHTTLRSLMLQHSLQAAVQRRRGADRRLPAFVWNGSLASAHIVRGLAELTHGNADEAYLLGLLHDIGNVVVLCEALEQEKLLGYQLDLRTFVWLCHEHHQRLGGLIGTAWQLPDRLCRAIVAHHRPAAPETDPTADLDLIELADMIKALLGYAPRVAYDLCAAASARSLGLTERPDFAAFLDQLPEDLSHLPPTF
jgi:HD-like signal output (HDOD) protein